MEGYDEPRGLPDSIDVPPSVIARLERQRSRRRNWLIALTIVVLGGAVFVFLLMSGRIVLGQAKYDRADARNVNSVDDAAAFPEIGRVAGAASIDPALTAELTKLQNELATLSSLLSTVGSLNTASAAATSPTIIREIIRTGGGASVDTSNFVTRDLFDAQVNGTNYSIESVGDGIAESVGTGALTVSGNTTLSGTLTAATTTLTKLTVSGTTTFSNLTEGSIPFIAGGVLTEDNDGLYWDSTNARLGIGTVSPTSKLTISNSPSNGALLFLENHFTSGGYPYATMSLDHYTESGNQGGAAITISNNGTSEATIRFDSALGSTNGFGFVNRTSNGPVYFSTNESGGGYSASTVRMLINSSGNVGIGTTNPSLFKLQVAGNIGPNADNTYTLGAVGSDWECVYYQGGSLGTCASDENLKTKIEDLSFDGEGEGEGALAKLARLRIRSFEFTDAPGDTYHGLIAQEVQEVLPELVTTAQNGYLAVKYGDIQWLVVSALQALIQKVEALADLVSGFAQSFTSERVTAGELCVDDICVTRDEFAAMVAASGADPAPEPSSPAPSVVPEEDDQPDNEAAATTTPDVVEADNEGDEKEPVEPIDEEPTATSTPPDPEPEPGPEPITLEESPSIETPNVPDEVADSPTEVEETVAP